MMLMQLSITFAQQGPVPCNCIGIENSRITQSSKVGDEVRLDLHVLFSSCTLAIGWMRRRIPSDPGDPILKNTLRGNIWTLISSDRSSCVYPGLLHTRRATHFLRFFIFQVLKRPNMCYIYFWKALDSRISIIAFPCVMNTRIQRTQPVLYFWNAGRSRIKYDMKAMNIMKVNWYVFSF